MGGRQAFPLLIKGLKRLEYRGYDSAGVALMGAAGMTLCKEKGKVAMLEEKAAMQDLDGTLGIAHTRWATHGEPSARNAHPHLSQDGRLALVHNGIIENYVALKELLTKEGYTFQSETDTEVLVQFIHYTMTSRHLSLPEAVEEALHSVVGAFAIAVLDREDPDVLVAARRSSPLVIGLGEGNGEFFLASDALPIIEYTHKMVYLNDNEVAVLRRGADIKVSTLSGEHVPARVQDVNLSLDELEKGCFPHFMLKEIFDQPRVIGDCMRGRLLVDERRVVLSTVEQYRERLASASRLIIVGCGTSWHAGLIGKQLIEQWTGIPVEVDYASEFRYRRPVVLPTDVVVAISQSGETADTLAAFQLSKDKGALCFGIVNSVGSSIARASDTGIYTHVGPEIGVASTKAFTGQVTVLVLLALALGKAKGAISDEEYCRTIDALASIPAQMEQVLLQDSRIATMAKTLTYASNALYMGRGFNYPVALEGALKLKEISYIHAEGYPAAEMKHGPIALIDRGMPVIFVATHHELYEKILSNVQEVKARGGRIWAIVTEGDTAIRQMAEEVIEVPPTLAPLAPLLSVLPLQMLSYHVAVERGLNVDQPRNLAKSVTVE